MFIENIENHSPVVNPSDAEATFFQGTRMQNAKFLKTN